MALLLRFSLPNISSDRIYRHVRHVDLYRMFRFFSIAFVFYDVHIIIESHYRK